MSTIFEEVFKMETGKKVLCVGLCVLDFVHVCDQFPVEDSDKKSLDGHWQRGGNASNNCTVLRNLGATCEFLGVLSKSPAFQFLEEDCTRRNIETKNCPKVLQDPIFSSVLLSLKAKTRTIICTNKNFPILRHEDFKRINLNEYKWIHFEARNYEETSLMMEDVIKYNRTSGNAINMSLELEKPREIDLILTKNVGYVFVGRDFAMHLGWNDFKTAVHRLRERIENKNCCIICTWGSEGAVVLDADNELTHIPSHPPEKIVDTLGAGDTFCAAVIYALSEGGKTIREAVDFGNRVAGFKLSFYGYDGIKNFGKTSTTD